LHQPPPSTLFPYTTLFRSSVQASNGNYFTLTSDVALTGNFSLEWWYKRPVAVGFNPFWSQAAGSAPEVYFFNSKLQVIDSSGAEIGRARLNSSHVEISYAV